MVQVSRTTNPLTLKPDDRPDLGSNVRVQGPKTLAEVDMATISQAARELAKAERAADDAEQVPAAAPDEQDLDDGERKTLRELEARDREVRAHEQAHKTTAGDLAVGGPSYSYQTGPDGKRYAIGGEVQIRLRSGRTPAETVRNMERAVRAANAPQSPSGPDRAVAAKAAQLANEARQEQQQDSADGRAPSEGLRRQPRIDILA